MRIKEIMWKMKKGKKKGSVLSVFCNGKDLINIFERNPRANLTAGDIKVLFLSLT